MCKRRKAPKGLRKNLGYFATLSFIGLPIVAVAGISQCSEHAHVHTGKNSLTKYIGEMLQNLPGLGMACGGSLLTWFNLPVPAYLTLGCTLENAAVDSIWISYRISHQAFAPACGSHRPRWNPLSHCPCILGMSSRVSFPLPNQFSLPRVPCVLTLRHLSGVRGQQLAWS